MQPRVGKTMKRLLCILREVRIYFIVTIPDREKLVGDAFIPEVGGSGLPFLGFILSITISSKQWVKFVGVVFSN